MPAARDDFHEWHNREHMPERVGIPGFRRGRRYVAISGAPEYFNLYEADSPETLAGQDYLNRLNAPTAWTQRVVPSFRNVARSICRVAFTNGVGSGGVMLTLRFAIDAAHRDSTIDALRRRLLPPLVVSQGDRRRPPVPRRRRGEQRSKRRRSACAPSHAGPRVDRARSKAIRCPTSSGAADDLAPALQAHGAQSALSAPCTGSSSRASRRRGRLASASGGVTRWPSFR